MPVKPSQSGARILATLDRIAELQPVGISDLARSMAVNIAAAQRALQTLAEEGWIRTTDAKPTRWELTEHIHTLAQHAYGSHDLRRRARPALEALWRETDESVLLTVPDGGRFVVIDVLESPQWVRSAPPIGFVVPAGPSATAWAMLPYMPPEDRRRYADGEPDAAMRAEMDRTRARGYAVSRGDVFAGSINLAAPVFEMDGRVIGAVLLSVPNDRAHADEDERLGEKVLATARRVSRGGPPATDAR